MSELTPEQQTKCELLEIELTYDDCWFYHDTDPVVSGPGYIVMKKDNSMALSFIKRGSGRQAFRTAVDAINAAVSPESYGCRWVEYDGR